MDFKIKLGKFELFIWIGKKPRPHPVKFARWILKYAKDHFDENNGLCHLYEGKEYTTNELYDEFKKIDY